MAGHEDAPPVDDAAWPAIRRRARSAAAAIWSSSPGLSTGTAPSRVSREKSVAPIDDGDAGGAVTSMATESGEKPAGAFQPMGARSTAPIGRSRTNQSPTNSV